ncbi:MAG TPA: HEAT repeat domain-containing protein [Phycisphaerae bacterium]
MSGLAETFQKRAACVAIMLACGTLARTTQAYVDLAPTLAKVITDSRNIAVVEVADFNRNTHELVLKETKILKGSRLGDAVRQQVSATDKAAIPRQILQWAEPGAQGVMFSSATTALVCVGQGWYQVKKSGSDWKLGVDRPDLPLAYYGTVSRLAVGIEKMLDGRDAVLTAIPHGVDEGAMFDTALNRSAYPGLVKVQRLRANLKMPSAVMSVSSNPSYMIGMGPVDLEDLPQLIQQLQSKDANERGEAAEDIRQLTDIEGAAETASAVPVLEGLLTDSTPRMRFLAAAAVLRITHGHAGAAEVLAQGLVNKDSVVRRDAAEAVAVTGRGGAPLVDKLAALMKDPDEATLVAGLQAIATLGPVAVKARTAIVPLLDKPDLMIDAADALGRLGPGAQPVPGQMVKMLSSDQPAVRWAAVRGMSQIGGSGAKPAVDLIARELPNATEIDGYNMIVYLALLGPVARATAATIQTIPIRNPVLPSATNWAMNADQGTFPWQNGGRSGAGRGPFGGGVDIAQFIYSAYVNELGVRLRPAALRLAPQLMDGTAGDVPEWGYKILGAAPAESLATVVPHLGDVDKVKRERAAIILGFMGSAAEGAKAKVEAAMQGAKDEKERNLLGWTLRKITRD